MPEDLLDLYFGELGKVRLLSADDEVRLAMKIEAGRDAKARPEAGQPHDRQQLERLMRDGQEAFDQFVAANLRLVASVARNSRRSSLDLDRPPANRPSRGPDLHSSG